MNPQSDNFQQQVIDVIVAWRSAFPNIEIPSPEWLEHWLTKYSSESVLAAIQTLRNHPPQLRARFDAASVGRAISASLRADAVKRAVAAAIAKTGGRS
jgi:hypothetical protein